MAGTTSFGTDGSEVGIGGGTLTATLNGTTYLATDTANLLTGYPAYDETLPWTVLGSIMTMPPYVWNGGSGNWDSGNWTPSGSNPSVGATAVIPTGGSVVSEQGNAANVIASLTLGANAKLSVAYGSTAGLLVGTKFTVAAGINNSGTITAEDSSSLYVGGTVTNTGVIFLGSSSPPTGPSSASNITSLVVNASTVTLIGGGQVETSSTGHANVITGNGAITGTLINVDNTISGSGQITVGSGSAAMSLTNEAAGVITANQPARTLAIQLGTNALLNAGLLEATSAGNLSIQNTTLTNNGTILANGGLVIIRSNVVGTGVLYAAAGPPLLMQNTTALYCADTLELSGGGIISFSAPLTVSTAPASVISPGPSGGTIEFNNALSGIAGIVGGNTLDLNMQINGSVTQVPFVFTTAAAASKAVVSGFNLIVACFAEGTHVLTDMGEVAVESLQPGNALVTLSGRQAPIQQVRWIGHRRIDCRRHPRPHDVWPVRIQVDAFGPGMPHRDLLLSPDHAVYAGGALIPVRYLVNSTTIVQLPLDEVSYWHVMLRRHDILLAEGLACESYLDTGNRAAFENDDGPTTLHPDFSGVEWAREVWRREGCAKLVLEGPELWAHKDMLLKRAISLGNEITTDPALRLRVDGVVLNPIRKRRIHRFAVPAGATSVRLQSRSVRPAHLYAASDDTRRIGVAAASIVLDGRSVTLKDDRLGAGWHDVEFNASGKSWRWTNCDAELLVTGGRELEVDVEMTERY